MTARSVLTWLNDMIIRLEAADFGAADVVLAITPSMERALIEELQAASNIYVQTVHHSEYHGWRIIVKGAKP